MTLSDAEAGDLMDAVAAALSPWMTDLPATVQFEDEAWDLKVRGISPDAPAVIKRLDAVYMRIIEKCAFAVDPNVIKRYALESGPIVTDAMVRRALILLKPKSSWRDQPGKTVGQRMRDALEAVFRDT